MGASGAVPTASPFSGCRVLAEFGAAPATISARCLQGGTRKRIRPGLVLLHNGFPTQLERTTAALMCGGPGSTLSGHAATIRDVADADALVAAAQDDPRPLPYAKRGPERQGRADRASRRRPHADYRPGRDTRNLRRGSGFRRRFRVVHAIRGRCRGRRADRPARHRARGADRRRSAREIREAFLYTPSLL
ncbi:hypothetical protein GCM10023094_46110 [Rhodococcus olei]|uniref:Uncharacterized protein n=1 Tax=Rhodococcus olei TaxID=2161675 RepID=A0ABP8PHW8_9NOCA